MFNNCNAETNGELYFFNSIRNDIEIIFDIGCRVDSEFLDFNGYVHYFDPNIEFIQAIKNKINTNKLAKFNNFGLGETNKTLSYYPKYQSFFNRTISCSVDDSINKVEFRIEKAIDYINNNSINNIDFLKIDTEGYELNVLLGFEDKLNIVKIIQFEYGGTYIDSNTKLIDVIDLLKKYRFNKFYYLINNGKQEITNFDDHYQYCNIVCLRE